MSPILFPLPFFSIRLLWYIHPYGTNFSMLHSRITSTLRNTSKWLRMPVPERESLASLWTYEKEWRGDSIIGILTNSKLQLSFHMQCYHIIWQIWLLLPSLCLFHLLHSLWKTRSPMISRQAIRITVELSFKNLQSIQSPNIYFLLKTTQRMLLNIGFDMLPTILRAPLFSEICHTLFIWCRIQTILKSTSAIWTIGNRFWTTIKESGTTYFKRLRSIEECPIRFANHLIGTRNRHFTS